METTTNSNGWLRRLLSFRKAASVIFFGLILYMVLSYLLQNITGAVLLLLSGADAESLQADDAGVLGWAVVLSVLLAALLIWFFFGGKKIRALVFGEKTEIAAVFGSERRIDIKVILFSACLLLAVQLVFVVIFDWIEQLLNRFSMTLSGSTAVETDYSVSLPLILYAVVVGPFVEELVFRGFILKGLKQYGKLFAIVTSALCFALMHGDFQQTIFTFFAGLIFGYIAMEYSIFWSFLLHVFNNYVLSELLGRMFGLLPASMQDWAAYGIMAASLAVCAVFLIRRKDGIRQYWNANRTAKGTYWKVWGSVLLILFALYEICRALGTIQPL